MSRAYKMADPEGCLTHQLQTGGSGGCKLAGAGTTGNREWRGFSSIV